MVLAASNNSAEAKFASEAAKAEAEIEALDGAGKSNLDVRFDTYDSNGKTYMQGQLFWDKDGAGATHQPELVAQYNFNSGAWEKTVTTTRKNKTMNLTNSYASSMKMPTCLRI